jgi:hypothetical protein
VRKSGPARAVVVLAFAALTLALGVVLVATTLFGDSHFEDNAYNLGVLRRSVLPEAGFFLETSLVHLYFQPYPLPRAED